MMKLALLGCTSETLACLPALAQAGFSIPCAYEVDEPASLQACLPGIPLRHDWEALLHSSEVDAVLIAGPLFPPEFSAEVWERRTDQLRKLVQAAVPLLVIPPVCEAIVGFELEMIRRDSRGLIFPLVPEFYLELENFSLAKPLPYEQITIEHALANRSRREVLAAFVRDVECLKRTWGAVKRISVSGGVVQEKAKPELTNISVALTGQAGATPCRWTVLPAQQSSTRWAFYPQGQTAPHAEKITEEIVNIQPQLAIALAEFQRALRQESYQAPTWLEACRSVEAMEAIDRSVERSRTIELYNEEISEASSFKGTMAVWGCLLMMLALAVFMGVGIFAMLFAPEESEKGTGRGWLWFQVCFLIPFAIFLLLQLLSFGLPAYERRKREKLGTSPTDASPHKTSETP
jgi:hypothetical protein